MPVLNKKDHVSYGLGHLSSQGNLGWALSYGKRYNYLMPVILNKDVNFPEKLNVGLNQVKICRKCRPLINLDVERPISLLHIQRDKRDNDGSLQFTDIRCGV